MKARVSLLLLLLTVLVTVGCASKTPLWLLYGRAQYAYGRIEMAGEIHCKTPLPPDRVDVCAEGARVQRVAREMKPVIDAELSKAAPDWDKILPYVDLILGAVGKAALVP